MAGEVSEGLPGSQCCVNIGGPTCSLVPIGSQRAVLSISVRSSVPRPGSWLLNWFVSF